jgi:hypothetical protein
LHPPPRIDSHPDRRGEKSFALARPCDQQTVSGKKDHMRNRPPTTDHKGPPQRAALSSVLCPLSSDRRSNKCRLRRRECELWCLDHCPCAVAGGKPPFPPDAPARIACPVTRFGGESFALPFVSSQGRWKNKIKTLRGAAPQTPRQGNDSPAPAI